jgi:hypothetical protein
MAETAVSREDGGGQRVGGTSQQALQQALTSEHTNHSAPARITVRLPMTRRRSGVPALGNTLLKGLARESAPRIQTQTAAPIRVFELSG